MKNRWSAVVATCLALLALQAVQSPAQAEDPAPGLTVAVYGTDSQDEICHPSDPFPPAVPQVCFGDVILEDPTGMQDFTVEVASGPGARAAVVRITFSPQEIAAAGFTSATDLTTRLTAGVPSPTDPFTPFIPVPWTVAADGAASLQLPPQDIPAGTTVRSHFSFRAAYSIREGTLSGSAAVTDDQHTTSTSPVAVTFYKWLSNGFYGRTGNGSLYHYNVGDKVYSSVEQIDPRKLVGTGWGGSTALLRLGEPRDSVVSGQYILDRTSNGSLYVHKPTATGYDRTKVGWGYNQYDMFAEAGDITGDGAFDFVTRSPDGALWRYDGLPGNTGFAPRQKVGWGWGIYDKVIGGGDLDTDGHADLLAREPDGNLWFYAGTGQPAAPFAPRVLIGWGWDIYDQILLIGPCSFYSRACLVARDPAGRLWGYVPYTNSDPVIEMTLRSQVGHGYTPYNPLF